MLKYLGLVLAELCLYLLIFVGIVLAIIPAICMWVGFGLQDKLETARLAIRKELGIRWRERNRAAHQRACGKRPN